MKIRKQVKIINKLGLHARAATKLVTLANQYDAEINIIRNGKHTSAASVMGLLMLETCQGQSIEIEADGKDAEQAMRAIQALIADRFEEQE